jgi:hypothetical protein
VIPGELGELTEEPMPLRLPNSPEVKTEFCK